MLGVVVAPRVSAAESVPVDLTSFTGKCAIGNAFDGALEPWGFAKISAMGNLGFTMTSGGNTPRFDHYQNVLLRPCVGPIEIDKDKNAATIRRADRHNITSLLSAQVMPWNIEVLATATRRCGLFEFAYAGDEPFHLLVDASCRNAARGAWQFGTHVKITDDNEIVGWHRFGGGWAGDQNVLQNTYQIFFVVRADAAPAALGTWRAKWAGGTVVPKDSPNPLKPGNRIEEDNGHPSIDVTRMDTKEIRELRAKVKRAPADAVGASLTFPRFAGGRLRVKVGLSQISIDQARKNLKAELPGWSIDEVERQTREKWNDAIGSIQVETQDPVHKQIFYQAFRNCMICPADKTGEHRKDPSAVYYDDWVAGWDTFPCRDPLMMLATPKRYGRIMEGMLTAAKHLDGFLFDVHVLDFPGPYQAYCNSEIWLAEAIQKDVPFDHKAGYAALLHNATKEPPPHLDGGVGRTKGSYDWHRKCLARRVHGTEGCGEYGLTMAVADYAIALAARQLGDEATYKRFRESSLTWRKHWDEDLGLLCPEGFYNEHTPFWGLFNLRHDVGGLVQIVGGRGMMEKYLEMAKAYCTMGGGQRTRSPEAFQVRDLRKQGKFVPPAGAPTGDHFSYQPFGDSEFVFWPVIYHWLGSPDRSGWICRGSVRYRPDLDGGMSLVFRGDDDGGGMSSYYLWCLLGLFPVAGQDVYLITSPCFPKVTFQRDGNPFTVVAENVSRENLYVQSAQLNGRPLARAWFRHAEISRGGQLVLVMGPQPSQWGREEPPPSVSDERESP